MPIKPFYCTFNDETFTMENNRTYGRRPFTANGLLGAALRVEKTKKDVQADAANADVASEEFNGDVQHPRNLSFLAVISLDRVSP